VSLDAAGFWKALGAGIVQALTERRREAAGDAASRTKSLLKRDDPQDE
jgi:hypothetical protein